MKVLFITHVNSMAGANRSMLQLIKELKEDYHVKSVVLAPQTEKSQGTIQKALESLGIPVISTDIRFFKCEHPTLRNIIGYARYLWEQRHLHKQLQNYHFDLIHSNSSVIDIGGYLSRQLKIKHVWHLREFGEEDYSLKPIGGRLYERYTYSHADAYIAISNIIAQHFKEKVKPEKIHTIYNGVFLDDNIPIAQHNNEVIQFFCAGVLCEGKNQKELILAFDELVNNRNIKNLHLTLVGIPTLPYINELCTLINAKNLNDYIDILPEVDNIQSLVSKMDVGLMPSKAEAFGRVTIEYQLQNLLVIANNAGANPELIQNCITGILYESGNYLALSDKILWAINHRKELTEIAQKGRDNARKKFTSSNNTFGIYRIYHELLGL